MTIIYTEQQLYKQALILSLFTIIIIYLMDYTTVEQNSEQKI